MKMLSRALFTFFCFFLWGLSPANSEISDQFFESKLAEKRVKNLEKKCKLETQLKTFPISCLKKKVQTPLAFQSKASWKLFWARHSRLCMSEGLDSLEDQQLIWMETQEAFSKSCRLRIRELQKDRQYVRDSG